MKENRLTYGKDHGFQIPPGYMENLEDRIFAKVTGANPETVLPGKTGNGFSVPDTYFESFDEGLLRKLPVQKKEPKIISLLNKESFYYITGVAAVFVAIVVNSFTQPKDMFTIENVDLLSLETYIDETINLSTPEVSRMVSEGLFSYAPAGRTERFDQEAVIEYLHENVEEPSLIFNED